MNSAQAADQSLHVISKSPECIKIFIAIVTTIESYNVIITGSGSRFPERIMRLT